MTPLRIAFVSSHPSMRRFRRDASFIYRCENLALALSAMGHEVSLLHLNALLLRSNFDVVVFLRPEYSWKFHLLTSRLRRRGITMIADFDDLIFDPDSARFRPSVVNQTADLAKTRRKFVLHAKALERMDKVQFSVNGLAQRYKELYPGGDCAVMPNAAHRSWYALDPVTNARARRISYFSGTRTHDRDFGLVAPVLQTLLERHTDLEVQIVGPVSADLQHPRVRKVNKLAFADYVEVVRNSYLCIAPLENTPFNQCKSALKAIEAGAMNVPTVASPVGEYAELDVQGVLLANSLQEWETSLEFALDRENYGKLSSGLRERMHACFDIDAIAKRFLEFAASSR